MSANDPYAVRGNDVPLATDSSHIRLQKLARITLDSMVQFVGLLDANGTVLEINRVALDAVGIKLSDVEGKPFWTTFWWQVSEDINAKLRESIARAARGEFVRWDTPIFGRAGGKETIIIDASLCPVVNEQGTVVYIAAEGRDITEKKAQEREIAQKNIELQALLERVRELDKIKTAFFSNVSHEFRTPLTLMLGPVEEMLNTESAELSPATKGQLELVNRNGLRLLRLVNTLLDFSRIEAGRVKASYEATELASFTSDLASVFRSAIERAGLKLVVDCQPLSEPAYIDREMWEKIVLNLLSNAFKFTFDGEISVSLTQVGSNVILRVRDTGTGIPVAELPKVFERFHRVENARGRTHEGSGIGLALVQDLVRLHGGSISVESRVGEASEFSVTMPLGTAHLPADQIVVDQSLASASARANAYVEEALRWLPGSDAADTGSRFAPDQGADIVAGSSANDDAPTVLIADDNADMRQYIARLLAGRYRIQTAADGVAALALARTDAPDLVISDVMMPRMDGFQLLQELRSSETLAHIPVILLSARAGEESRIEGMEAGADDYLVKPFSAKELQARVAAHVHASQLRKDANQAIRTSEERFRALVTATSDVVYRMSPDWSEMRFLEGREFIADTHQPRQNWLSTYIHPDDQPQVLAAIQDAVRSKTAFELEHRVLRVDGTFGWTFSRAVPILDARGEVFEWFGAAADVTARRDVQAALAQQRRLYEAILTNTPDLAYVFDLNHRFIYVNEGLLKMWGRSWNDAIGKTCLELGYEPWHAAMHNREIDQVAATKKPIRGEVPFSGAFGRRIYDYIFVPVFGADGSVEAVAGTTRDVTERKQSEELMSRLAAVVESADDAIISKSLEGIITSWNAGAARVFGYTAEEAVGRPITMLFPSDLLHEENTILERIRRGERIEHYQTERMRKDGVRIFVSLSVSPIKEVNGKVVGASKIARDISDQRRHAEALQLSEARLRAVVEATPECVKIVGPDGGLEFINHAGLCMIECESEPMLSGACVFDLIAPEHRATWIRNHERICAGERLNWEFEIVGLKGTRRWMETHAVPLPLSDNRVGQLAVTREITARKAQEREREELLNSERAARSDAEHASRLKDDFLATLSHELRTPLNAILGWSQLLTLKPDPADFKEGLEAIQRNARAQTQLIEDLLDMSRIISGKVRLDVQWTDLAGVINAAIDSVRPSAEAKGIRIRKILDPLAGPVSGDPTRLQQVVWNLLTNAVKFTPKGGKVDVLLERVNSHLEITVHDSGIGIKPDFLPVVFERFRQADASTTRSFGGLGLGLSIVKHITELHGGTVRAKSAGEGQGATFSVCLPVAPIRAGESREHPATSKAPALDWQDLNLEGIKVLLIDDEPDARALISRLLTQAQADVRTAGSADDGLHALSDFSPDVLISDIGMPGKDGYQFLREVRQLDAARGGKVPAIALTAFARSEDRTRAMMAGYHVHISKPIEPQELLAAVGSLSGRTGGRR